MCEQARLDAQVTTMHELVFMTILLLKGLKIIKVYAYCIYIKCFMFHCICYFLPKALKTIAYACCVYTTMGEGIPQEEWSQAKGVLTFKKIDMRQT